MHSSSTSPTHTRGNNYTKEHHYAIDAASLLSECRKNLGIIITQQQDRVNANILDLDRTLLTTEQLLHFHLLALLEQERQDSKNNNDDGTNTTEDESQFHNQQSKNHYLNVSSTRTAHTSNHDDLDSSNHAITLEPIMGTVEELKNVLRKRNQRKRSLSFLNWHHYQQEQDQDHKSPSTTSSSNNNRDMGRGVSRGSQRTLFGSKHYSKTLRAAQKHIARTTNINKNVVDVHFPPSSIAFSSSLTSPSSSDSSRNSSRSPPYTNGKSIPITTNTSPSSTSTSNMLTKPMEKTARDSILFRLIVALQLCLVRIEEAKNLLCPKHSKHKCKNQDVADIADDNDDNILYHNSKCKKSNHRWMTMGTTAIIACASTYLCTKDKIQCNTNVLKSKDVQLSILKTSTKALILTSTSLYLRHGWRILCMNARLLNTIFAIEDLHQQWMLVNSVQMGNSKDELGNNDISSDQQCKHLLKLMPLQKSTVRFGTKAFISEVNIQKFTHLIDYILFQSSIWESQGAFRYGLIKWAMDILYASVGVSLKVNKQRKNSFMVPLTAAAAASYYAITGPSDKSAEFISTESSDLLRNAWGVVSLPAVKTLSLQASRLLKGAAIAERINICGVSCFILSKKPFPGT
jgi:hypothetical protein